MQKHISHWDMPLLLFVSSCHLNLEVVFFSHFLNYFICQQTFGILRKANITSNDFYNNDNNDNNYNYNKFSDVSNKNERKRGQLF